MNNPYELRRARNAQREVDDATAEVKLWTNLTILTTLGVAAAATGWTFLIRWGLADMGVVDKGETVFALTMGMIVLTIAAITLLASAACAWYEARIERLKAKRAYEDTLDEIGNAS